MGPAPAEDEGTVKAAERAELLSSLGDQVQLLDSTNQRSRSFRNHLTLSPATDGFRCC